MKAHEIYRSLSTESFWATQSRTVRWLAARSYAGVISFGELMGHTQSAHGIGAAITAEDAHTIVSLR